MREGDVNINAFTCVKPSNFTTYEGTFLDQKAYNIKLFEDNLVKRNQDNIMNLEKKMKFYKVLISLRSGSKRPFPSCFEPHC